jgi:hypothetical protein
VSRGLIKPRDFEVLIIYSSSFFFFCVQLLISLGVTEKKRPGHLFLFFCGQI